MSKVVDLCVIGAGPAGLAAAARAAEGGLHVLLLDEQSAAGGQVWRNAGTALAGGLMPTTQAEKVYHGAGAALQRLAASGVDHRAGATLVDIAQPETGPETKSAPEAAPGPEAMVEITWRAPFGAEAPRVRQTAARAVIAATGAQERPVIFPGAELPGVMGVGAIQTAYKQSGLVPDGEGVVLAGHGPLLLLTLAQIRAAGGRVAAVLDLGPPGAMAAAARALPRALIGDPALMAQGVGLMLRRALSGVPVHRGVTGLRAHGTHRTGSIEAVSFTSAGRARRLPARLLGVHDGVIPNAQVSRLLSLRHVWDAGQGAFVPVRDADGAVAPGIWIVGDGAGIGGAGIAAVDGEQAALAVLARTGRAPGVHGPAARRLARRRVARRFVEALFPPVPMGVHATDDALICRCENVRVADVLAALGTGIDGPNRVKAMTRCGMGPCQGRICANPLTRLIAAETGWSPDTVGALRIRPPLKPVLLMDYLAPEIVPELSA
jgi:NADPH-dependent 2,4-dienoyl-CoA reductase/sulfur reductase-like enzyme